MQSFGVLDGALLANDLVDLGKLTKRADLNRVDSDGSTALHHAVYLHASNEAIELLLTRGAQISARGPRGGTPLHWAYHCGSDRVISLLIANGADPYAVDDKGDVPEAWQVSILEDLMWYVSDDPCTARWIVGEKLVENEDRLNQPVFRCDVLVCLPTRRGYVDVPLRGSVTEILNDLHNHYRGIHVAGSATARLLFRGLYKKPEASNAWSLMLEEPEENCAHEPRA